MIKLRIAVARKILPVCAMIVYKHTVTREKLLVYHNLHATATPKLPALFTEVSIHLIFGNDCRELGGVVKVDDD